MPVAGISVTWYDAAPSAVDTPMAKTPLTFDEIEAMLRKGHGNGDVVNRLYEKHLRRHKPNLFADRSHLSAETVDVIHENWPTKALMKLLPGSPSGKVPRLQTSDPVFVVRDRGVDSLIDGGKRVSTWHRDGDPGPHYVAVLSVRS